MTDIELQKIILKHKDSITSMWESHRKLIKKIVQQDIPIDKVGEELAVIVGIVESQKMMLDTLLECERKSSYGHLLEVYDTLLGDLTGSEEEKIALAVKNSSGEDPQA